MEIVLRLAESGAYEKTVSRKKRAFSAEDKKHLEAIYQIQDYMNEGSGILQLCTPRHKK